MVVNVGKDVEEDVDLVVVVVVVVVRVDLDKNNLNILNTEKIAQDFQNNGSWNPVMHGCQFPDFVQSCQMSKFGYFPEWLQQQK